MDQSQLKWVADFSQRLREDFISYRDGFSPNVQEILAKFKFRDQIPTMMAANIEESLLALAKGLGKDVSIHLFGYAPFLSPATPANSG
jgi:hypothetical protein